MKDISSASSAIKNLPGSLESTRANPSAKGGVADNIFKDQLKDQLQALQNAMPSADTPKALQPNALKFSNHAVDRMQARGVRFSPEEMGRIESAVGKAEAKGAKNTLLLTDTAAMIVSIKDKTVVTVMDKANLKENVFTNIDSTVMV